MKGRKWYQCNALVLCGTADSTQVTGTQTSPLWKHHQRIHQTGYPDVYILFSMFVPQCWCDDPLLSNNISRNNDSNNYSNDSSRNNDDSNDNISLCRKIDEMVSI